MATKQQHIDLVYQNLKRVAPGFKPERQLVEHSMGKAWSQILHNAFRKDLSFLDFYVKDYKDQAVSQDADTNQYYVDLPVAIAQLPDKSEGVRAVLRGDADYSTPAYTSTQYVPVSDTTMEQMDSLDCMNAESGVVGYAVRYDKIMFDRKMTAILAAKKVHLKLVVPFDVYDATENIPVPSGQGENLVMMTIQFLMGSNQQQQ